MTDAAPFHNSEEMHYEPTQSSVCPLSVQSEYFGGVGGFILLLSTVELIIGDCKPEQEESLRLPFGSAGKKESHVFGYRHHNSQHSRFMVREFPNAVKRRHS